MVEIGKRFSGEFDVTLDEAGRINLPRHLRDTLKEDKVVITKGADPCIWLYTVERWMEEENRIVRATNPYSVQGRKLRRHYIGPSLEIDIDKQGRILIPPALRDFAGLSRECKIVGQHDYVEIWDGERYKALQFCDDELQFASEEMGGRIQVEEEKELDDGGKSPHSGAAGGDSAISRSEKQV